MGYLTLERLIECDPYAVRARYLLFKVLERAVVDAASPTEPPYAAVRIQKSHIRSARKWIFNTKDISEFSFLWVCDHLKADPKQIRKLVQQSIDNPENRWFASPSSSGTLRVFEVIFENTSEPRLVHKAA